jgi:hypothetical protein
MSINPALTEMVAQTRMADMQQAAAPRRRAIAGPAATEPSLLPGLAVRPVAARRAIGWFLVGVGLRLAVSRPRSAAAQ